MLKIFLININRNFAFSPKPVRNDDRRIHRCVGKTVLKGGQQMGRRIAPCSGIQGIGVGQKGKCAFGLDQLNHFPDKNRPDECGIAGFSKMQLHRNQIPGFHGCGKSRGLNQPPDLVHQVFLVRGPKICKIDNAFHNSPRNNR